MYDRNAGEYTYEDHPKCSKCGGSGEVKKLFGKTETCSECGGSGLQSGYEAEMNRRYGHGM